MAAERAAHPATVAQRRTRPFGVPATLPAHAAKVVQRSASSAAATAPALGDVKDVKHAAAAAPAPAPIPAPAAALPAGTFQNLSTYGLNVATWAAFDRALELLAFDDDFQRILLSLREMKVSPAVSAAIPRVERARASLSSFDCAAAFVANPGTYLQREPLGLHEIGSQQDGMGWQSVNDATFAFTLSQRRDQDPMPMLRMMPTRDGGGFDTIVAKWCNASAGGAPVASIPYCDFHVAPGVADPRFVFTVAMNGCSFIVASAVPASAPPLAAGRYRLLHDRSHYKLEKWAAAGYTVRFAAYTEVAEAGATPAAWAAAPPKVISYNPKDYPWTLLHEGYVYARVVANFLAWDGHAWQFGSRHYHEKSPHNGGKRVLDRRDAPANRPDAASSTQYLAM